MNPFGNAQVSVELEGRWALSLLTEGWTAEEKAALNRGERGALDALSDEAVRRTLQRPDTAEVTRFVVQNQSATFEGEA